MPLPTEEHYALLAHDITVTHAQEFAEALAATDDQVIADAYNLLATPDYWAWRTSVLRREILFTTSDAGTTFTFVGNGYIGRTNQELTAWRELFAPQGDTTNPSLPQVQQALQDIFSGTGNAQQNRVHIAHISRRLVLRIERLFATGAGTTAAPGLLGVEGALTYIDIAHCLRGVPLF